MKKKKRILIIILDSLGCGELPDAKQYGDDGSNTLKNIDNFVKGLILPNLTQFGIGNILKLIKIPSIHTPIASFGKMAELSVGKDTVTGHWEIAGIKLDKPFKVFPNGFASEIMTEFTKQTGLEILGNYAASGTEIIKELGDLHIKTKKPIIYTSADSVFQIAAHEKYFGLEKLYTICKIARKIVDKHQVARVIARPFIGESGSFERTYNRHDYSIHPTEQTILDCMKEKGYDVIGIGKIHDIYNGAGITQSILTKGNKDGLEKTLKVLSSSEINGLVFLNLVDFDSMYGHRRDTEGYAKALMFFDEYLKKIIGKLSEDDLLIMTADHGCDPTYNKHTDHTREYVPLFVYDPIDLNGKNLGIRETFSDVAASIAANFNITGLKNGMSFL